MKPALDGSGMHVPVFTYGSYMDPDVLRRFGADPGAATRSTLPGWRLTFTPHANIVKDPEASVEGFLFSMPHAELDKLYGPQGFVTTYKPVPVIVHAEPGRAAALTFVEDAPEQAPDGNYLDSFLAICGRLGLPGAYLDAVRSQAEALVRGTLA